MKFLLDSVILIDHFNEIPHATDYLLTHRQDCAISVITRSEVLTGFSEEASLYPKQLLDNFPLLEFTADCIDLTVQLRRKHKLKLPDAIQAAIAKYHNLKLITRNTKDFKRRQFDFVIFPYEI